MADTMFTPGTTITSDWLNDVNDFVYGSTSINASDVVVTPTGNISSTNVQAALVELDSEKQPLDADLTAIAALTTTAYGRALLEVASEAALKALLNLEIGTDVQAYNANTIAVAPSTNGNVLTVSGGAWTSAAHTIPTASGSYLRTTTACPAAGNLLTIPHGFGTVPTVWKSYLKCVTTEANWAADDIIDVTYAGHDGYNWVSYADATNVYIRMGSNGAWILNKTTGVATALDELKWSIVVDIWK